MTKGELAKNYYKQGLNCAQAVALAFEKELGLDSEVIKKLICGFGGGFGRQGLVCGAVSAMTMVLSYLLSDGEDKLANYKIIQSACEEVKAQLGSLTCAELLEGVTKDNSPIPDARTAEYYKKRPCAEICEICANITEKYLKHE